ncbi:hypothetical protein H8A97_13135 [Bradyrhizobium sp. Arg62]|uniref:phage tail protein n=1 Tax=Bradyrhizobium brasilense TaxID=1419277 RepID=UPI001E2F8F4D|nr:phage tail protein [Bradyrhizobium brasilense]MCC8946018.1 hypothetical protein [Bradyrhizobium brasilense]
MAIQTGNFYIPGQGVVQSYDDTQYNATPATGQLAAQFMAMGGTISILSLAPQPTPTTTVPSSTVAPYQQFGSNTAGAPIMVAYGSCRLAGAIIWITGIEASADGTSSYVTMQCAYCEPADAKEPLQVARMWADSTQFYDVGAGGVLTVANLTDADQQALADCVAAMEVHWGGPGEQPSAIGESILGVGEVPGYVGLRTIVFPGFPLAISNNSTPNISVEFQRTDTALVDVSECIEKVMGVALKRRGYPPSYFEVEGITDQCYGVISSAQGTVLDFITRHKDIYRYQILDGDPIRIVRREVNSGLTIDFDYKEADILQIPGSPAVQFQRTKPEDMPVGIDLTYPDVNRGYDMKPVSALHEGSAPSNLISSMTSEFITDGVTARSLAYDILYTQRARGLREAFIIEDTRAEPGDVIQITTTNGDLYVTQVERQTYTKDRTNVVQAINLLTATGFDVDDDSGASGGSITRLNWPQDVMLADFVVTADKVYTALEFPIYAAVSSYPNPPKKILSSKFRALDQADVSGSNWSLANFPTNMFEDDSYVYWLDFNYLCLSRLAKSATTITGIQTWTVPAGFYVAGGTPHDVNFNHAGNSGFFFRSGKLHIPWTGGFNGSAFASSNDIKLVVVDISMWGDQTSAAWEIHDVYSWTSGDIVPFPKGVVILDNGLYVIPTTNTFNPGTKFYKSSDLASWSTELSSFTYKAFNTLVSFGNVVYGLEESGNTGVANEKHRAALWDFSSGFSEAIVDLRDDPNVVAISQTRGWWWRSDTHFFINCNTTNYSNADRPVVAPRRYIARRKLSDGSADGGAFFDQIIWNGFDFSLFRGRYFNGKCYLHWDAFARNNTRLTEISEDLDPSTAVHMWPQQAVTPVNDDFASAKVISTDQLVQVDMRYGTTEAGEDYPPWALPTTGSANDAYTYHNGHSMWHKWTADATGTATVTLDSTLSTIKRIPSALNYGRLYGIVVWTGSALGSLTEVAHYTPRSVGGTGTSTATFSATSGTDYFISVYAYSGSPPNSTFDLFGGAFDLNTDFYGITTMKVTT